MKCLSEFFVRRLGPYHRYTFYGAPAVDRLGELRADGMDEQMNVFLDAQATKDEMIKSGIAVLQYIYRAPATSLGQIRYNLFSQKMATACGHQTRYSTSTEGAAAQHSLRACLQTLQTGCFCRVCL